MPRGPARAWRDPGVEVIDSMSTSIGLGLIARAAAEAIERGAGRDEVVATVRGLIPRIRVHLAVRSLDSLVRSGRVSRMKGRIATFLHLKPLIRLSAATGGKPVQGSTVLGVRGGRRKILELMKSEIDPAVPAEFAITHANAPEAAQWFKQRITRTFHPRTRAVHRGGHERPRRPRGRGGRGHRVHPAAVGRPRHGRRADRADRAAVVPRGVDPTSIIIGRLFSAKTPAGSARATRAGRMPFASSAGRAAFPRWWWMSEKAFSPRC